jgi:uncharacterized protein
MRSSAVATALALSVGLAGCVSLKRTPEARFFALRATAAASPADGLAMGPGLIGVLPVLLPAYLERPQVVTWAGPGEVRIDEFLRWAEPLDLAVARVVEEDLGTLLPSHRIIRAPWSASAALRCRVRLDLARFGPQPGGEVQLAGRWVLLPARGERPLVSRPVELRRGPRAGATGIDPNASVEAMSELLGELSREIATAVAELPAAEAPPRP